jgi:hypothetical protein
MRIWREILDLKQVYFCKRKEAVTHAGSGVYNLPEDFYELIWVQDPDSTPFYPVNIKKEREELKPGFVVNGQQLIIVNWETLPDNLYVDYRHFPKEFADWTGGDDPEETTYELDYPLNNQRGLRLISNIIPVMAKVKDGSLTEAEFQANITQELVNFMPRYYADMTSK